VRSSDLALFFENAKYTAKEICSGCEISFAQPMTKLQGTKYLSVCMKNDLTIDLPSQNHEGFSASLVLHRQS
jgi:hypothetical protein